MTTQAECRYGFRSSCVCHISPAYCYRRHEKKIRSMARPKVSSVDEVFDESGRLKGVFHDTDIVDKLAKRHRLSAEAARRVNGEYRTPVIVELAYKRRPTYNQLVHKYPWAVVWFWEKDGKIVRVYKRCTTVGAAVGLHKKLLEAGRTTATIVSRSRAYYIPTKLVGKIPKPWKWCPYCCKPRKYRRLASGETFFAPVKTWSEEKGKYVWKERELAVTQCRFCHHTNRDQVFRNSNQPWEVRKIKRGVRRVRKQKVYK